LRVLLELTGSSPYKPHFSNRHFPKTIFEDYGDEKNISKTA
jgi:hypothetical protein